MINLKAPHLILHDIVQQYGSKILGEIRLKGMLSDLMPTIDKRYHNVFKKAIDDQVGTKLLELEDDEVSVRIIKINALRNSFKTLNSFDETAFYVVDCFLYTLGWIEILKFEPGNEQPDNIQISLTEVKIGKQIWAGENLNVAKFRNGDFIPPAKAGKEWKEADNNEQPAWCYYENETENGNKYGKLYNWYAVNDPRGLAPEGWYIPTYDEWNELVNLCGGDAHYDGNGAGTLLKSVTGWDDNRVNTDKYGFSALPGGYRVLGKFEGDEHRCCWWSATEYSSYYAMAKQIWLEDVWEKRWPKECGFSVRCLKDK
jgi:uncharacterized protein (TIGR02145 family)